MMIDCCLASTMNNYLYLLSAASIIAVATIAVNSVLYTSRNQIKGPYNIGGSLGLRSSGTDSRSGAFYADPGGVYSAHDKPVLDAYI